MKTFLGIIILLLYISVQAQEIKEPKWFHLEGVTNAQYKVYLDVDNMNYAPGVTIIAKLKYQYKNDNLIDYITKDIKFIVSENTYQIINQAHFLKQGTVDVEPVSQIRHLVPGTEISVIYQSVYIQAVTIGPSPK